MRDGAECTRDEGTKHSYPLRELTVSRGLGKAIRPETTVIGVTTFARWFACFDS